MVSTLLLGRLRSVSLPGYPSPRFSILYEKSAFHILPKPLKNVWSVCPCRNLQILKVSSLGYQCNALPLKPLPPPLPLSHLILVISI